MSEYAWQLILTLVFLIGSITMTKFLLVTGVWSKYPAMRIAAWVVYLSVLLIVINHMVRK